MTRLLPRAAAAILAALLLAAIGFGAEGRYDSLTVRIDEPDGRTTYGYAVYRVTIINRGEDDRSVTVTLDGESSAVRSLTGAAQVPAGSTVELPIYQPAVSFDSRIARISIDGTTQREPIVLRLTNAHGVEQYDARWGMSRYEPSHLVLASWSLPSSTVADLQKLIEDPASTTGGGYYGSTGSRSVLQSSPPTDSWSGDWLDLSRYLAIVLLASEFEALPEQVRSAILGSVHAGGNLMLLDGPPPPNGDLAGPSAQLGLNWAPLTDPRGLITQELYEAPYGFGTIQWMSSAGLEQAARSTSVYLFEHWTDNIQGRIGVPTLDSAERVMPVVDELSVPRRMTFIFLVIFAVLAGPVNLVLLKRMNRRTLLFVTAPLLGLFFSATVFVYGLIHDGVSTISRISAVTILDQRSQRASTLTQLAFYAPLTPRGGLSFPMDTEVTPILGVSNQRLGSGQRVSIAHSDAQHYRSGWISPRQPAHFSLRTHAQRRERVLIERNDRGQLVAINGLGTTIDNLIYHDQDLAAYAARDIEPGASAVLTMRPRNTSMLTSQREANEFARHPYPSQGVDLLDHSPASFKQPSTYVAELGSALFAPRGREGVRDLTAREIVIGFVEPAEGSR